jgi:hypothetical protein
MLSIRSLDMGVPCCSFCVLPGHRRLPQTPSTGECATNQEKQEAFLARKKKLNENKQGTPSKPTKPCRHGAASTAACARSSARSFLKENMN